MQIISFPKSIFMQIFIFVKYIYANYYCSKFNFYANYKSCKINLMQILSVTIQFMQIIIPRISTELGTLVHATMKDRTTSSSMDLRLMERRQYDFVENGTPATQLMTWLSL